jgi:hypothetical protein
LSVQVLFDSDRSAPPPSLSPLPSSPTLSACAFYERERKREMERESEKEREREKEWERDREREREMV